MKALPLLTVSALAPLVLGVSVASAHVVVKPSQVGVATFQTFDTSVPNEKEGAVTALRLVIPDGLNYVSPTVKPGWIISTKKSGSGDAAKITEISWTGGSIPAEQRDDFTFSAQVPASATTLQWKAYQTYADGTVVAWDQTPPANGADSEDSTPYSQTTVINDLAATPSASKSTDTAALTLSVVALALSVVALTGRMRKS